MDLKNLEFASIDFESTGHREGIGDEPIQIGIAVMKEFEIDIAKELVFTVGIDLSSGSSITRFGASSLSSVIESLRLSISSCVNQK